MRNTSTVLPGMNALSPSRSDSLPMGPGLESLSNSPRPQTDSGNASFPASFGKALQSALVPNVSKEETQVKTDKPIVNLNAGSKGNEKVSKQKTKDSGRFLNTASVGPESVNTATSQTANSLASRKNKVVIADKDFRTVAKRNQTEKDSAAPTPDENDGLHLPDEENEKRPARRVSALKSEPVLNWNGTPGLALGADSIGVANELPLAGEKTGTAVSDQFQNSSPLANIMKQLDQKLAGLESIPQPETDASADGLSFNAERESFHPQKLDLNPQMLNAAMLAVQGEKISQLAQQNQNSFILHSQAVRSKTFNNLGPTGMPMMAGATGSASPLLASLNSAMPDKQMSEQYVEEDVGLNNTPLMPDAILIRTTRVQTTEPMDVQTLPDDLNALASKFDNVSFDFEPRTEQMMSRVPLRPMPDKQNFEPIPLFKMNLENDSLQPLPLVQMPALAHQNSSPLQTLRGATISGPAINDPLIAMQFVQTRTIINPGIQNPQAFASESALRQTILTNQPLGKELQERDEFFDKDFSSPFESGISGSNLSGVFQGQNQIAGIANSKSAFQQDSQGQNPHQNGDLGGRASLTNETLKDKGSAKATLKEDAFMPNKGLGEGLMAAKNETTAGTNSTGNATSTPAEARAISQAAMTRAKDLAAEIQAKGGGTAKVQIRDNKLGVIDLKINMGLENKIYVEISSSNEKIKVELEKGIDDLKKSLDKQKLTLADFKVTGNAKLAGSDFHSSQGNGGRSQEQSQQQQMQQQNLFGTNGQSMPSNSFGSSGNSGFAQSGWDGNGARMEHPAQNSRQKGTEQSASAALDRHKNVQRGANGSLKVFA